MLVFLQNVSLGYSSGFISYKLMEKTVTIATESVDFMDLTDTNPENNWYQFYTKLQVDRDKVESLQVFGAKFRY